MKDSFWESEGKCFPKYDSTSSRVYDCKRFMSIANAKIVSPSLIGNLAD